MDGQDFNQQPVEEAAVEATTVETAVEPQQNKPGNGLAIAAMIFGIASILLGCCYGGVLGIPGLIMGIIANKKNKTGFGTAAIITSIIGLVFFVVLIIIACVTGAAAFTEMMNQSSYY